MSSFKIKKGEIYRARVVGMPGVREIRVNTILTKVVTCEDIESKMNMVARIRDLEQL